MLIILPNFNTLIMVSTCCYNLLLWQHIVLYKCSFFYSMPYPFTEFIGTACSLTEEKSRKLFILSFLLELHSIKYMPQNRAMRDRKKKSHPQLNVYR